MMSLLWSPIVIVLLAVIGVMALCMFVLLCFLYRNRRKRNVNSKVMEPAGELAKVTSTSTSQHTTLHGVVASSSCLENNGEHEAQEADGANANDLYGGAAGCNATTQGNDDSSGEDEHDMNSCMVRLVPSKNKRRTSSLSCGALHVQSRVSNKKGSIIFRCPIVLQYI